MQPYHLNPQLVPQQSRGAQTNGNNTSRLSPNATQPLFDHHYQVQHIHQVPSTTSSPISNSQQHQQHHQQRPRQRIIHTPPLDVSLLRDHDVPTIVTSRSASSSPSMPSTKRTRIHDGDDDDIRLHRHTSDNTMKQTAQAIAEVMRGAGKMTSRDIADRVKCILEPTYSLETLRSNIMRALNILEVLEFVKRIIVTGMPNKWVWILNFDTRQGMTSPVTPQQNMGLNVLVNQKILCRKHDYESFSRKLEDVHALWEHNNEQMTTDDRYISMPFLVLHTSGTNTSELKNHAPKRMCINFSDKFTVCDDFTTIASILKRN